MNWVFGLLTRIPLSSKAFLHDSRYSLDRFKSFEFEMVQFEQLLLVSIAGYCLHDKGRTGRDLFRERK